MGFIIWEWHGLEGVQLVKLYPEWSAGARFKIQGVKKLLFYCNRDGMFSLTLN